MVDLNVMLLEHARTGLQTQLDAAVTNGDTEAARKVADEISKLNASVTPKAPPYGDAEIRSELNKLDWFGVDPKKSGRAIALGRDMDPKKFGTAVEFAAALVKAVDEEFKPTQKTGESEDEEDEEDEDGGKKEPAKPPKKRASDGPGDGDTAGVRSRRATGPWLKLSDAPADVQKEINRTADKFAPKTKEGRETYVAKALEAQHAAHLRNKAKK